VPRASLILRWKIPEALISNVTTTRFVSTMVQPVILQGPLAGISRILPCSVHASETGTISFVARGADGLLVTKIGIQSLNEFPNSVPNGVDAG
jgi:hypothetical protein